MAIKNIPENTRLKLELDGGMKGDRQVIKAKTFSKVKAEAAQSLVGLQTLPLFKVKRLEEIELVEE